jgi:hypothetical protein
LVDPEKATAPSDDGQLGNGEDFRPELEKAGIPFPAGASATFYREAQIAVVVNTEANMKRVAEQVKQWRYSPRTLMRLAVRIVEYQPDAQLKLEGPGSWETLRKNLGKSAKLVCEESVLGASGWRVASTIKQNAKAAPKHLRTIVDDWPPKPGVRLTMLEAEFDLSPDDEMVHSTVHFNHASPASGGQPAIQVAVSGPLKITNLHSVLLKTFTVSDPKPGMPLRHYAVIATFEITDDRGRGPDKIRMENENAKPKVPHR